MPVGAHFPNAFVDICIVGKTSHFTQGEPHKALFPLLGRHLGTS